jgi:hypothetical protein
MRLNPALMNVLTDETPPRVVFMQPREGDSVTSSTVVTVDATDDTGILSVEFFVDGALARGGIDYTEPYEYAWNTAGLADGSIHSLCARATDTSYNSAVSDTIHVAIYDSEPNVIVLVIDGARYTETFGDPAHTNVKFMWNNLCPQGTLFSNFRNNGATQTNPGHASIASGTWQYIANDGSERPSQPTFFEYIRCEKGLPQSETYVVAGKSKLNVCSYSAHPEYGADCGSAVDAANRDDIATYQALLSRLQSDHPRLVLVNFAEVDVAGHSGVWDDYIQAIQIADSLVNELWSFIENDDYYAGTTTLIITNDHGRHTTNFTSHGDGCEGCRHIMCLALGPNIKQGYTLDATHTQIDICPTIAASLGFSAPYADGSIIGEMFSTLTGVR